MSVLAFDPSPRFAFPRSYIGKLNYWTDHDVALLVDNVIVSGYTTVPGFVAYVILFPQFIPWTSNRYTLDFLVVSAFYTYPTPDDIHDYAVDVIYQPEYPPALPRILIRNSGSSLNHFDFDLEAAPSDYWLFNP